MEYAKHRVVTKAKTPFMGLLAEIKSQDENGRYIAEHMLCHWCFNRSQITGTDISIFKHVFLGLLSFLSLGI